MNDDCSATVPIKIVTIEEAPDPPARWSTRPPTSQNHDRPRQQFTLPPWRKIAPPIIGFLILLSLLMRMPDSFSSDTKITLTVFAIAVWFWVFTDIDDTYVALSAATALAVIGIIEVPQLFSALGDDTMWLLIGAFIIASAVSASGLAERGAVAVTKGVSSPRVLVHLITLAIVCTVYAVPATSGRAALVIPVFLALAHSLGDRDSWLTRTLSLVFPITILFSAVGSLIGAGAHLITNQILTTNNLEAFSFTQWLLFGLPLALISSHTAAELVLFLTTTKSQRKTEINIQPEAFTEHSRALSSWEIRTLLVLIISIVLWSTENLHGIHPAVVALIGGLLITCPCFGSVSLNTSIKKIPWSLLLFMAATLAMSRALTDSGAAKALAKSVFGEPHKSVVGGIIFIILVIVVSSLAHLLVQSRSARSAVLIPLVIVIAPSIGVNPLAAAFISTAAAGFCHTLPASAKPLAMFKATGAEANVAVFNDQQLLRVSLFLLPLHLALCLIFAFGIWPLLGLNIFI
ncbi:SLC13 family permease [Corynebacterium freiburgense]|uniref:SLC13 family permease n=1 Tax=Corynebacterium freiburgense TaxID=556548 RepID=UPI000424CDC4|nr:SLC13 family permease [Corynebacterium freiburgense]WJZ03432.1 Sodium-dependent dicarboxylate transporter SdcS [Corynebacterium freiburgense]